MSVSLWLFVSWALAVPGDVVAELDAPGCYPDGLAWDGSHLWVSNLQSGSCADPARDQYRIERLDPGSGAVVLGHEWTSRVHHGLAWGDDLYAQVGWSDLVVYEATSGVEIASFDDALTGFPTGLAYDPLSGVLFVSQVQSDEIDRVDPTTGAVLSTLVADVPSAGNGDLAWDGCALWLASASEDLLVRLDPLTGERLDEVDAPAYQPSGLTWDGSHLWVSDTSSERIYRVEVDVGPCDPVADMDGDGVEDAADNCPMAANASQDDSDGDLAGDACDLCPGADDRVDGDGDGAPDGCDTCPGADDHADADGDSVADACDACAGSDDRLDADADTVPDGCDLCPGGDDAIDSDEDGFADACDVCEGADDAVDSDQDEAPDGCDLCPGADDRRDVDADGVPDACDACRDGDDALDADGDDVPDACDACAAGDDHADIDQDGFADACDACPEGPGACPDAEPEATAQGCGCATGGGGSVAWLWGLVALLATRRATTS